MRRARRRAGRAPRRSSSRNSTDAGRVGEVVLALDAAGTGRVPRARMFSRPSSMRSSTSVIVARAADRLELLVGAATRSRTPTSGSRRHSLDHRPVALLEDVQRHAPRAGSATMPSGNSGKSCWTMVQRVYAGVRQDHEDRMARHRHHGRSDGAARRAGGQRGGGVEPHALQGRGDRGRAGRRQSRRGRPGGRCRRDDAQRRRGGRGGHRCHDVGV